MAKHPSELIRAVGEKIDADIYLFAGMVKQPAERELSDCIKKHRSRTNALLILTTYGGGADAAYQMARCLQRLYSKGKFILFIDTVCKSAGTLMALGADELVMADTAEMGPLDVQVAKPGEIGEYLSGLTAQRALDTLRSEVFRAFEYYFLQLRFRSGMQVTTRAAADIATELTVGTFVSVYGQFEPMRLGDNERANLIAYEYGQRIKTRNAKEDTLERLIGGYPSHGFVIDREEAGDLFNKVRPPTDPEAELAGLCRHVSEKYAASDEFLVRYLGDSGGDDDDDDNDEGNGGISEAVGEVPKSTEPNHGSDHHGTGPHDHQGDRSPEQPSEASSTVNSGAGPHS